MYECPNCGGNLKFDIPSQQMLCAFCESKFDPYAIQKETDTVDGDCFETNVFLCPQCGGEMISSDNDATSFCSYCGSANILSSRISREKRPRYIVPFQISKEDCKKAYGRKMRKAFFVPKELKNPDFIEGFRGIYMPYWSYRISQKGPISFKGKTVKRKGDYVYTDHYDLTGELDAGYEGYVCDASSAFYDNISEALGPYDIEGRKDFTPAFLSGFYAETADVNQEVYKDDAEELAVDVTFNKVKEDAVFRKHGIQEDSSRKKTAGQLNTFCEGADSAMFPVWFMSYRNGDRIAYATVNGQTGKVVADLPVDKTRFLVSSLLLAVPLFFLLNLFMTLRPMVLLACVAGLAAVAVYIYNKELAAILKRETNEEDRGFQVKNLGRKKLKKKNPQSRNSSGTTAFVAILTCVIFMAAVASIGDVVAWIVVAAAMCIICVSGYRKYKKLKNLSGGYGFLFSAGAVTVGGLLRLWKPVSDLWYYGGAVLILLTVVFVLLDLIRNYNRLAMRKLPQFDKKGGDDNA